MLSRLISFTLAASVLSPAVPAFAEESRSAYVVTDLVANRSGVSTNPKVTLDPKLINPWGLAFGGGPVWTANNGSDSSSLYNGKGAFVAVFGTPTSPTGIVWNSNARLFTLPVAPKATTTTSASFIFSHEDGEISAWSGALTNPASAVSVWPANPAVSYKGLALGADGNATYLYAADFKGGKVDVFSSKFAPAKLACGFQDPLLPKGYAPFGIQNIAGDIVVAYALQADANGNEAHGAGLGRVDIYTAAGCLSRRLQDTGTFNAPWGIALAPASFGKHGGQLLVGNFGSGWIGAYDFHSGEFQGYLKNANDKIITIDGLWGIAFGNGAAAQATNTLFYAAGANQEADGLYGRIDAVLTKDD